MRQLAHDRRYPDYTLRGDRTDGIWRPHNMGIRTLDYALGNLFCNHNGLDT